MKTDDWNPSYKNYKTGEIIFYEKKWYCNENKIIHQNEKEFKNCKHCKNEK